MVTRSDELSISKLAQPPSKAKKSVAGSIEPTSHGIGEFWDTLGGETKSNRGGGNDQKQEPNSNKQVQSSERN